MAKLVAKLVTSVVVTRVLVPEDATDEQVQALAKPRLLNNLENDYEDTIGSIQLDTECPFVQYSDEDELIDVYASVDVETWKKHEKEIMAFSIDDRNYNNNDHRMTFDDDYSVDIRLYKSDLDAFTEFTNFFDTREVKN